VLEGSTIAPETGAYLMMRVSNAFMLAGLHLRGRGYRDVVPWSCG